jgi:hypothetical protein
MSTPPERIVITIPTAQKRKTSSLLGGGTGPFKLNILFNEYESLLFARPPSPASLDSDAPPE